MAAGYTGLRYRDGDVIIVATLEAHSAIIDFEEILAATKVVEDDHVDAPWENWDGYEHTATPIRDLDVPGNWSAANGEVWCPSRSERLLITIDDVDVKKWGNFDYYRRRGASKQVAAELVAREKARTIKRLCEWYRDGWHWYGVTCEFNDHEASVWGIDDEEYAEKYVRLEIAGEVAYQLEKDGYTVINQPATCGPTREDKLAELRRKLNSQNWQD